MLLWDLLTLASSFVITYSTDEHHPLQYSGDTIQNMLLKPMYRFGDRLMNEIHDFNLNLMNLISNLRVETPEAVKTSNGLCKGGEPKFVSYCFNAFVVKTKFGWNSHQWKDFIKLREKTKHIFKYLCSVVEGLTK